MLFRSSRDFAASVVQMERIEEHLNELINQQGEMIKSIDNIAQASIQSIAPNPKLIQVMSETNTSLEEFKNTVSKLNQSAELLKQQEIEIAVRREVEKLLINKISGNMDESNQKK